MGSFHTGSFYFGSLLIHKTHRKEYDVIICSDFFPPTISKLRHAIHPTCKYELIFEHVIIHWK